MYVCGIHTHTHTTTHLRPPTHPQTSTPYRNTSTHAYTIHTPYTQDVIEDYVISERMLKEGREDGILGLPTHLSGDEVIAAKQSVMRQTIDYLKQNYSSAEGYAHNIGR